MKTRRLFLLLFVLIDVSATPIAASDLAGPDALIQRLLTANPQLRALEAEWKSARQHAVIVGALPEPMFVFDHYVSSVETSVG